MKLKLKITYSGSLNSYAKQVVFDLSDSGLTVGRLESTLNLPDTKVSGQHLHIFLMDSEKIGILDLGSRNGTYLNNQKTQRGVLKLGDQIRIGDSKLTVIEMESDAKPKSSSLDPLVVHGWPHVLEAIPQLKK